MDIKDINFSDQVMYSATLLEELTVSAIGKKKTNSNRREYILDTLYRALALNTTATREGVLMFVEKLTNDDLTIFKELGIDLKEYRQLGNKGGNSKN